MKKLSKASAQEISELVTNSNNVTPEVDINYRVLVKPSSDHSEEIPSLKERKNNLETKKNEKMCPKEHSLKVRGLKVLLWRTRILTYAVCSLFLISGGKSYIYKFPYNFRSFT